MKKVLIILLFSFPLMSFSSVSKSSIKSNADLIGTNPCADCLEACCLVVFDNPNGSTRTIKVCCSQITIVPL